MFIQQEAWLLAMAPLFPDYQAEIVQLVLLQKLKHQMDDKLNFSVE